MMRTLILVPVSIVLINVLQSWAQRKLVLNTDVGLNAIQMIDKHGYPFENHPVTTEDGYILGMHRIPHGRNGMNSIGKGVVFMVPALLCDSSQWVMNGNDSLAFILADNGYDVWLGNTRGLTWSRKHVKLDPDRDKKEFWNFGVDEAASRDVPAMIDYILSQTGQEKLFYVGHSQGTALFFMLMSEKPEYNSKIRLMFALSPAIFINHMDGFLNPVIFSNIDLLQPIVERTQSYELLSHTPFIPTVGALFCNDASSFQPLCSYILRLIAGFSQDQFPPSLIPIIVSNIPAGSSFRQLQQIGQVHKTGCLCHYNHGKKGNVENYGQSTAPPYDLSKISAPVAVYYAGADNLITVRDVRHSIEVLPNVVVTKLLEGFNHFDLVWGKDAPTLIFSDMLKQMDEY